jgi:hypothetical protein
MISRTAEHVHIALELGSCLLLVGAWGVLRRKRRKKDHLSQIHEVQLKQKDLLIREVHHRVANQMGLTAALLHLQGSRSLNPAAKADLFDSESRVRTLSKLHTRLHQTHPQSQTLLYPYLSELASDLITTLRPDLVYCPEFSSDSPSTQSNTAITCGLLVHELITNCIKHAFPHNRIGTIRLSLHRPHQDRLRISIHDNGAGLPSGFDLETLSTSGMAIISALTRDLAGTFSAIQHPAGTEFIAEFPLPESEPTS